MHAIELIEAGKSDQMVAWQNRAVVSISLEEGIVSYEMVKTTGQILDFLVLIGGPRSHKRS